MKYRDAETGGYVSDAYARANPATTVHEDDSRVLELEARVRGLEGQVQALAAALTSLAARVQAG